MAKRNKPTMEDRVAEYVDSPSMKQRVKHKKQITARIQGVYGNYRTQTIWSLKKVNGECTCPSELWPCKHILALRETWKVNPKSFFDLDHFLKNLAKETQDELMEMFGKIVVQFPECLGVLGVPGFEEEDERVEY